jgi:type VI secretion system protein ImpL
MKLSLGDPAFLTILLVAVVLFAVVLIAVAVFLVLKSRKKADDAKPEESAPEKPARLFPTGVPGMKESFREAMRRLREKLPGWNYRYSVPWYALVGATGSGKTTLANQISGLSAELITTEPSEYAPRWLLLDQAVLIDLPGKSFLSPQPAPTGSTTKPADFLQHNLGLQAISDRAAWKSFLRLAGRYRPRQPLNGIVLTISATELQEAAADPDDIRQTARIVELSQRLDDIQQLLDLSLPVYVLVTKCDAITGFGSYSRSFIQQVNRPSTGANGAAKPGFSDDLFGWSNPHLLDSSFSPDWVDEAFDSTNEVLLRRQLEMLAASKTPADADGVFLFPFELQSLRASLQAVLDRVFRPTAYYSPHLLRGIYFCGRESPEESATAPVSISRDRNFLQGNFAGVEIAVLYVRNLFEAKVFPERYLATPTRRTFLSRNRSVMIAQIAAVVLVALLGIASIRAWNRIGTLQRNRINPVLQSLSTSLDSVAVSSGENVTPAADLFNALGQAHENQYYSLALPYSYVDLEGLHRDLRDTLERTFEIVVLRSCKYALENRIAAVLNSSPSANLAANQGARNYPPGSAWSTDPGYLALDRYLSDLRALHKNIDRYRLISSAGSGSFVQLNQLLHYLGGRDLPDTSRFAQDASYQRMLLDATWEPIEVQSNYDELTAAATKQRIADFYRSWFDFNPLIGEVQTLAGRDGLQGMSSASASISNEQLRSIVSQAQAIDNQLNTGSYDWLAEPFNRQNYPALGAELDALPFADSQFTDGVTTTGSQKLAALKTAIQTTPVVLDIQDGKVRLGGDVRTTASILDALLGYEIMADTYESSAVSSSCALIPAGTIWNQADLGKALDLDAMRTKIDSELLPGLPGQYHEAVQRLVDRRAANALSVVLRGAAVANPNQGDKQASLQTELQNLSQSVDQLKRIGDSLATLHATSEESCLTKSLARQAGSLLVRINQQLPALYGHAAPVDQADTGLPVSLWLYGVSSSDDLQAYLAGERQQIETLSAEAAPLVQLMHSEGAHSDVLTRWRNISQDVEALQAKKAGNPIQTLETFIATDLDKITPAAACKGAALRHSSDVFLSVRADLSNIAVNHCYATAVARFNEIAADFNQRLAGRFPFSQLADTRSGSETDPSDIAQFYQTFDRDSPGLLSVLPGIVEKPDDAASFLSTIATVRPLVSGTPKDPTPALGLIVHFRTNRNREVFGNRIAQWNLQVGQKALSAPPDPGDGPPLLWHFGDPVELTLRYANNAPETPAAANPSPAARVQGKTVTFQYNDAWSLFAMLRDHPPASTDPGNQYAVTIPNAPGSGPGGGAPPVSTVVYIQIDLLPIGAKPGGDTLPVPAFPYQAPQAVLKPAHGE